MEKAAAEGKVECLTRRPVIDSQGIAVFKITYVPTTPILRRPDSNGIACGSSIRDNRARFRLPPKGTQVSISVSDGLDERERMLPALLPFSAHSLADRREGRVILDIELDVG